MANALNQTRRHGFFHTAPTVPTDPNPTRTTPTGFQPPHDAADRAQPPPPRINRASARPRLPLIDRRCRRLNDTDQQATPYALGSKPYHDRLLNFSSYPLSIFIQTTMDKQTRSTFAQQKAR